MAEERHALATSERLLASADFQWFLKEAVLEAMEKAQEEALDVDRSPEIRDRAAHVRKAIEGISNWLKNRVETARPIVNAQEA